MARKPRSPGYRFADAQRAWIRRMYPIFDVATTVKLFNERFDTSLTHEQIRSFARRLGVKNSINGDGRFKKGDGRGGHKTGEALKAFLEGGKATRFKKGEKTNYEYPMYSERWRLEGSRKSRTLLIKVPGPNPYTRQFPSHLKYHWIRKAVWVWEQAHGKTPKGHCVVQTDGDPANCELDNLECVPRKVVRMMNNPLHIPRRSEDGETNRARFRMAQVKSAVAKRRKERSS